MDYLEKMRSDYDEWQRKIAVEKRKHFDLAFKSFIREHKGETIEEVRRIILDLEEQAHRDKSLSQMEFSREFRIRFDEHVESQIVVVEEV
ncbi:hypothetical protein P7H60_06460 [Vagococcus carniphilus]|uniref:hypothetical protein n=1 Tax=Vagococcus carniphilus TaxID=218144 RepID=UPI00288D39A5|nr:hypothetical protein [Vagococcus carniphilus]MDT2848799.1 hypothetical protein [Vagococcus carniphilus]